MSLPTPPAPIAMQCQLSVEQGTKLVDTLEIVAKTINAQITKIKSDIDEYIIQGLMSTIEDIDSKLTELEDKYAGKLPNYLDKVANFGDALAKYEEDFNDFHDMLQKCSISKLKSILRSAGPTGQNIASKIPNVDKVIDSVYVSSSAIKSTLQLISKFNPAYLRQQKSRVLTSFQNDILQLVDSSTEFIIAMALYKTENTYVGQVIQSAALLEQFLLCISAVTCPEFEDLIYRYNNVMGSLPLSPNFNSIDCPSGGECTKRISPNYKLDINVILDDTMADATQKNNIINCKNSITNSMTFAKNMVGNYSNPSYYFT